MHPLFFIFFLLSAIVVVSSTSVIVSRNAVHSVLFLVLTFISSAGIWLLLDAEFLAWILILVYVGAVMTLFLFVVMMINLEPRPFQNSLKYYFPFGLVLLLVLITLVMLAVRPENLHLEGGSSAPQLNNIKNLGSLLYTQYVYAFELVAILLLTAIIAAISLTHRPLTFTKKQRSSKQIATSREESIKLVKMQHSAQLTNGE